MRMHKYPRTRHLEGSRLQPGDEDLAAVPFAGVAGRHLVVEEKIDGANAGVCFVGGVLHLQSRGHFLTGGPRERHFALLKSWARCHEARLREVLGERYVMYGEWTYAKHTIFYDALPTTFWSSTCSIESAAGSSTPRPGGACWTGCPWPRCRSWPPGASRPWTRSAAW